MIAFVSKKGKNSKILGSWPMDFALALFDDFSIVRATTRLHYLRIFRKKMNKRLTSISSSKKVFDAAIPPYQKVSARIILNRILSKHLFIQTGFDGGFLFTQTTKTSSFRISGSWLHLLCHTTVVAVIVAVTDIFVLRYFVVLFT